MRRGRLVRPWEDRGGKLSYKESTDDGHDQADNVGNVKDFGTVSWTIAKGLIEGLFANVHYDNNPCQDVEDQGQTIQHQKDQHSRAVALNTQRCSHIRVPFVAAVPEKCKEPPGGRRPQRCQRPQFETHLNGLVLPSGTPFPVGLSPQKSTHLSPPVRSVFIGLFASY